MMQWRRALRASESSTAAPLYTNTCLVAAFQSIGVPVKATRNGPFFALRDSNQMLQPFGKQLVPYPPGLSLSPGLYVLWRDGHFVGVEVQGGDIAKAMLNSDEWSAYDPQNRFFLIVDIPDGELPQLDDVGDVSGGAGSAQAAAAEEDGADTPQAAAAEEDGDGVDTPPAAAAEEDGDGVDPFEDLEVILDEVAAGRVAIRIPDVAFAGPPHLGGRDPCRVRVPADGLCLYHCICASKNLREWLASHDANGHALDKLRAAQDVKDAKEVRAALIASCKEDHPETAVRLAGSGPDAYPGACLTKLCDCKLF